MCLQLDDVHEVPEGSPGAELLGAIGTADLAFTDAETAALARRFGRELTEDLHGWPALVRLSLTAEPAASWRYAAEEVLQG